MRNLDRFATLGCAVLIGTSRKGFLGTITGRPVGGAATASVGLRRWRRAWPAPRVVRVHDVAAMVDAIKVWGAVAGLGTITP